MKRFPSLFSSPEFYPLRLDFVRRTVDFVHMTPEAYRASSFLDHRTCQAGAELFRAGLDELLEYHAAEGLRASRIRYILHTAFCCSTLLARCLEELPSCLVLKEPHALTQLADVRPGGPTPHPELADILSAEEWPRVLELVLTLLARIYHPEDAVLIKVNDRCNSLGGTFLERDPESKALFAYTGLRSFLLSVLKDEGRRQWLRRDRLPLIRREMLSHPELAPVAVERLTDAEGAACLWLQRVYAYRRLRREFSPRRAPAVNSGALPERPVRTLRRAAQALDVAADGAALSEVAEGNTLRHYSKDPHRPYDARSRDRELAELDARFGAEADAGVAWAESAAKATVLT
jgi:hypothetical protein